ncbi:DUF2852 domain-containing protein [Falsiroseomonas tokyonensis]|uniref:DUF2852 domain-containing protein n=1 Tax=Falsiroseomonas tokyonensis TaxID=430521 RepID=A0ABV7BXP8_9PROT|nr:DUF2852 domain-containing protein [Falsiroseomonas tokyonensis]
MSAALHPIPPAALPQAGWRGGAPWPRGALRGWRLPAMIAGFIAWWPIGLALLTLFAWRHAMFCSPRSFSPWGARRLKHRARAAMEGAFAPASSGNAAFDEHREAVLRRLEEERLALDAQQAEFADFLAQLRRAKDQEEFDRFMASCRAG